jgi:hypothetical protein
MRVTVTVTARAALAVLLCVAAPAAAHADFLVEPFLAWSRNTDTSRWVMGGGASAEFTAGWLVAGGEVGYAAGFFEPEEDVLDLVASSHVLTVTGHAGASWPGRSDEERFLPYITAGFGWMRQDARDREGLVGVTRNDPALHVGGGVRAMFNDFLGVRVDVRRFLSLRDPYDAPDPIVADLQRLRFWRLAVGAVIRFGTD